MKLNKANNEIFQRTRFTETIEKQLSETISENSNDVVDFEQ